MVSSRRQLLAGTTVLLGGLAIGCGRATEEPVGSEIDEFVALFEGYGAAEVIDPGMVSLFIDEARAKTMYDGLFELDDTMQPVPRLAQSAEPNADGTRWRLRLRDARWHDGGRLTSTDVLYTLARVLGPARAQGFTAASNLAMVDLRQSREIDRRTVEIACTAPSFEFPTALCSYGTRIVPDGSRDFDRPVGTGPFRFESFDPGQQLTVNAYQDYWDGAPSIRRLRLLSADSEARTSALRSGQADFIDEVPAAATSVLKQDSQLAVNMIPNNGAMYFAMKTDRPPFDDPDVRRAMMHLADRPELVRIALQGKGDVANDVFGKGYQHYADLPRHDYDPDRARHLLDRAGARDLRFDLQVAPVAPGVMEAANLFSEQARKVGVRAKVRLASRDTYYARASRIGPMTMGQSGPLPVPNHFGGRLVGDSSKNVTRWHDEQFDRLYTDAMATASLRRRSKLYHRMHEILHNRGGYLFWAHPYRTNAARAEYRAIPTGVANSLHWARFDKVTR